MKVFQSEGRKRKSLRRRHRDSKLEKYERDLALATQADIEMDSCNLSEHELIDTPIPPVIVQSIFAWISPLHVLKYSLINKDIRDCLLDLYFAMLCLVRHMPVKESPRQYYDLLDRLFFRFPKSWQKAYSIVRLSRSRVLDWRGANARPKTCIPKALCLLSTSLIHLNIGSCKLIGTIPREIGRLVNLEFLSVAWNLLEGSIPAEVGNLANLKYFYASDNYFDSEIPSEIGSMLSLEVFDVSNNKLIGEIPHTIGGLSNIKTLLLQNNRLCGLIPEEIAYCVSLETLNIYENAFEKWEIPANVVPATRIYKLLRKIGFYEQGTNRWR
ncbi:hypothetical protein HK100_007552 [Physocladia obscura]|uniref:L domain-like protein n=1 Tax=Physocladia obscura TaxID=109957 RepID=A0AAD5XK00_9FUNG|nr:hypothetical protein HK100_007552 [Physocladia obscura]